jgi:hypothetical protein
MSYFDFNMKHSRILILFIAFVLMGQGCFGGGQKTTKAADGGVFKTVNAGDDWVQAAAVPSAKGVGTLAGVSVVSIEADPQDSETLYLGTISNGLFYSHNGGEEWMRPMEGALKTGTVQSVAVSPKDVCTVYIAKGQRLYKTENCLREFDDQTYVETRANVRIEEIEIDWFNPDVIWLGLSNGDILRSEDAGGTWRTVLETKNDTMALMVHNGDSRIVLVGTAQAGIYKTIDGGDNWVQIKDAFKTFRSGDRIHSLVQNNDSSVLLAATKHGILRSTDYAESFEGLELLTAPSQVTIKALAMDPANADTIYYAALSTFYRSINGGADWATRQLPTTRLPERLLLDPRDPGVLYIGVTTPKK